MNTRLILAVIAVGMILTGSAMLAYGQESEIEITTESDSIYVLEVHDVDASESEIIGFWIQSGYSNIVFTVNDSVITESASNNIYYLNMSELNITGEAIVKISYSLDKDTTEFQKTLQYDTSSLSITFDGNEIYTGTNLKSGSTLNIALQKEIEGKTTTVESIPTWVYAVIVVLIILMIVVVIRPTKKQKSTTKKESSGGSEELLSTKKTLLMEILKEIEKRHRSGQISDDTYHKLKGDFKQDAVETMKKLEDMK